MHHILPFYGKHQQKFLKSYIWTARLSSIPLLGRIVKYMANLYARRQHGGFYITLEDAERIIDASENIKLGPCSCRQVFTNCDKPVMTELVIGAGDAVYADAEKEKFKQLSKKEAKELMRRCHEQGMLHTIVKYQSLYYAICNCCTCCCVPYRLKNDYGIQFAVGRNKSIVGDYIKQQH